MKDYFYFNKKWHYKTLGKGRKGGFAFQRILTLSTKRTIMPINEGLIFIDLMFRRYNRTFKPYHQHEYERERL